MNSPENWNPYAPPPSRDETRLAPEPVRKSRSLGIMVTVHALTMAVALMCQLVEVETIMFLGPVFCITGTILGVMSIRAGRTLLSVAGWSAIAYAILVIALINVFEWSPDEATSPLAGLSITYALGVLLLILWSQLSRADDATEVPIGVEE
jgi:peptidoglycan/LPS O-acetylase OafA/YrhL